MLFFCAFNVILLGQKSIGIIDAFFGLLNLYFFYQARQNRVKNWHSYLLIASLTTTIFYTFYVADLRAGSAYWLLFLPPLYCLLAGSKRGLVLTVLLSFPAIFLLYVKSDSDHHIAQRSVVNFTLTYFLSYIVCYLYENQHITRDQTLQKMAFQDPLTGAKNRHALKMLFDNIHKKTAITSQQESTPPSKTHLLIVDIDYFKRVNDKFGHDVGDTVLIEITQRLMDHVGDDQVYRIGGEEFLIILKQHSSTQAFHVAENIRQKIEASAFYIQQHEINITVSIGIAQLKADQSFQAFLQVADHNLYSAKRKGRNVVHYGSMNIVGNAKAV
ncbi:GGDEF domain-containing protein [Marinomonas sp. IMCC 4694]|nr:GGDEF domain-containing protein [Marinomonas sp. IMCC 4694]